MKRRTVIASVLSAVALVGANAALAASPAAAAASICDTATGNIVANCGFETGDFGPWVHDDGQAQSAEGVVNDDNPNSGTYNYYDGSVGAPDTLSQALTVTPGDTYQLSFEASNDDPGGTVDSFVASVTTTSGGDTNTQTVFTDSGQTITDTYVSYGGAFTVPATATSTATLTFTIEEDPSFYHLDDVEVLQTGGSTPASVSLSASPASTSPSGTSVTLTATVSASGPTPTGSVGFTDNGTAISGCAAQPLTGSNGTATATCATSALPVGTDSLVANYSGDTNHPAAHSTALSYVVTQGSSVTVVCLAGQPCSASVSSPGTGQTATITAAAGAATTLSASFGTAAAPIHPCTTTVPGVLTFTGNRQKTIVLARTTNRPTLIFCYGQPTPFITVTGHLTTFFSKANNEYEGILPPCLPFFKPGPCITHLSFSHGVETVTVKSNANDPHISH